MLTNLRINLSSTHTHRVQSDIHNVNRNQVQIRGRHGNVSTISAGPRRTRTTFGNIGVIELAIVFCIYCLLCTNVCAQQCTPCPSDCTCPMVSSSSVQCSLDCSSAGLNKLPSRFTVPSLDSIVSISFEENDFSVFNPTVLTILENLQYISLHSNPFTCDCSMAMLQLWLSWKQEQDGLTVRDPDLMTCHSPASLAGMSSLDLTLGQYGCAPTQFGSCVTSSDGTANFIVFSGLHDNVPDVASCRHLCFNSGSAYGTVAGFSTKTCLCGDIPTSANSACSCVDSNGDEIEPGLLTCGLVYLRNTFVVDDQLITLTSIRPYSSTENAILEIGDKISLERYIWNFVNSQQSIVGTSQDAVNNFYYAQDYDISIEGESGGVRTTPLTFPLRVLDPVVIDLGDDVIYADVDTTLDLEAVVTQGSDFSVIWTYEINGSQNEPVPETFCPTNWLYHRKRCTGNISSLITNYDEASTSCHSYGAQLVMAKDATELQKIANHFATGQSKNRKGKGYTKDVQTYFLGARKTSDGINYVWEDTGQKTYFTAVNVSNSGEGPCVTVSYNTHLHGSKCEDQHRFLCQKEAVQCDSEGVYNRDTETCYSVASSAAMTTYSSASSDCQKRGGYLAEVNDAAINQFLLTELVNGTSATFWIGLNSLSSTGVYIWSNGYSLGKYAPWKPEHGQYSNNKCVSMATDNLDLLLLWEARSCDENLPYVCQYPPGGKMHTTQSYIAGQSGTLSPGQSISVLQTTPPSTSTTNINTIIISGLGLSHGGILHGWNLDIVGQSSTTVLNLVILRPHCSLGYYLVTPDCVSATSVHALCSTTRPSCPDTRPSCPLSQQYCVLSQTCISVFLPCTCAKYPGANQCSDQTSGGRRKRSPTNHDGSYMKHRDTRGADKYTSAEVSAKYLVVGTTLVELINSHYGLTNIQAEPINVDANDVIAFQYATLGSPIKCTRPSGDKWNTEMLVGSASMFLSPGDVADISSFVKQDRECSIIALYSDPVQLKPSEPYLDKAYYVVGNFTYSVHAKNAISYSTSTVQVHFQKKVSGFGVLANDVLYQSTTSNTSYDCYLESGVEYTFLFAIDSGSDVFLSTNCPATSHNDLFAPDCPTEFDKQCQMHFTSRSPQFSTLQYQDSKITSNRNFKIITYMASNNVNQMSISLNVQIQERISALSIMTNVSSYQINVHQTVKFRMYSTVGSHVSYTWSVSDNAIASSTNEVIHTFTVAGHQVVRAAMCNRINCANNSLSLLVINEANISDWTLYTGGGAYEGEDAIIIVSFKASVWSKVTIIVYFGDGFNESQKYMTQEKSSLQVTRTHKYMSTGTYFIDITMQDQLTERTINISDTINVCRRLSSATIEGSKDITVFNKEQFVAHLLEHKIGIIYEWNFGDGSPKETTSDPSIYHTYSITGSYVISVETSSCVGALSTTVLVSVHEAIAGFTMTFINTIMVGNPLDITFSYTEGTEVNIIVTSVMFEHNISSASRVESIQHIFNTLGTYNISAIAFNQVSQMVITKPLYVYDSSEFDVVDLLEGDVVVRSETTTFTAVVLYNNPSELDYKWDLDDKGAKPKVQTVTHIYDKVGEYHPSVEISKGKRKAKFTKIIHVEDKLQNLQLYTNSPISIIAGRPADLLANAVVDLGSNYAFLWTFNGTQFSSFGSDFITMVTKGGDVPLKVKVFNNVNSLERETMITINEAISGISISTNATSIDNVFVFKFNQIYLLAASVILGNDVSYKWDIGGFKSYNGEHIFHTFTSTGSLMINIMAENSIDQLKIQKLGYVMRSLEDLKLESNSSAIATNQNVLITAVTQATNISCEFRICLKSYCETTNTTSGQIGWSFASAGTYDVSVIVFNQIDRKSAYSQIEVYHDISNLTIIVQGSENTESIAQTIETTIQASFSSVSAVSLQWTITKPNGAIFIQTTEEFLLVAFEDIGSYAIQLVASNGKIRRNVSKSVNVVQPIKDVALLYDAIENKYLATDRIYTFNASVGEGSTLSYIWTFVTPAEIISSNSLSCSHQFNETGFVSVSLNVSNPIGNTVVHVNLTVESEIMDLSIENNLTDVMWVPLNQYVRFTTSQNNFWPIEYRWNLNAGKVNLKSNLPYIDYKFDSRNPIHITMTSSNHVSNYSTTEIINAEEKILGLKIVPKEITIHSENEINFTATVTAGSAISYLWEFEDHSVTTKSPFVLFTFPTGGVYVVKVIATNKVSEMTQTSSVTVVEKIIDVFIVGCCDIAYPASTPLQFVANVTSGTVSSYNWTWTGNSQTENGIGQVFDTSFPAAGKYQLGATAVNSIGTDTVWVEIEIEEKLESVHLEVIGDLFGIVNTDTITLLAVPSSNQTVFCEWIVNYTQICKGQNNSLKCDYQFTNPGTYVINVKAYNNVSVVNNTKILNVHEIICSQPAITLVGNVNRTQHKSLALSIDMTVTACSKYSLTHNWTIYGKRCNENILPIDTVILPADVSTNTPVLYLPERTLNYGNYCLHFTSQYSGTPGIASPHINVSLSIDKTPLVAVIKGGSGVVVAVSVQAVIDGSLSYDPDLAKTEVQNLTYFWYCREIKTNKLTHLHFTNGSTVIIEPYTLVAGIEYNITLWVMSSDGRRAVAHQQILGEQRDIPMVSIVCVSCRDLNVHKVSDSQTVKLIGECEYCSMDVSKIVWQVSEENGTVLELNSTTTTTGNNNTNLVLKAGSLKSGQVYNFKLNVTSSKTGLTAYSVLTLFPSWPPSDGQCDAIHPQAVTAISDFVYVSCTGWVDNSASTSPLTYKIYVANLNSEWYPIYHGTQSEATLVLAPFKGDAEDVFLIVLVSDHLGMTSVGLNKTIHVISPELDRTGSSLPFLKFQVATNLPFVQRTANPKQLLSYTITVVLELNRETLRQANNEFSHNWKEKLENRTEIRRELLRVLNVSLTSISSIDDVQQTAYALNLLTKYAREFPKENASYEAVLRLCDDIITTLFPKVSQGWTGDELVPEYLLSLFSNVLMTIHLDLANTILDKDYDLDVWMHRKGMMEQIVSYADNVTSMLLTTQVVDEKPYVYECGLMNFTGGRVRAAEIQQHYGGSEHYQLIYPKTLLANLPPTTELFQKCDTAAINPYSWGFPDGLYINSFVAAPQFTFTNGSEVTVQDLPEERKFVIAFGRSPTQDPEFWRSLKDKLKNKIIDRLNMSSNDAQLHTSDIVNMPIHLNYSSTILKPKTHLSSIVNSMHGFEEGGTLGFDVSVRIFQPHLSSYPFDEQGNVSIYLGLGFVPHKYAYDHRMTLTLTDQGWSNPEDALWTQAFNWLDSVSVDSGQLIYMSINNDDAHLTVNVSVALYVSTCKFYDPGSSTWLTGGCEVTASTNATWTVCRCDHMTMFGSSVYLAPSDLDFDNLLELDFSENPVVIGAVCVLAGLLIIMLILAHRWDLHDLDKVTKIPLCGKNAANKYEVTIITGRQPGAGTTAHVGLRLFGYDGKSLRYYLHRPGAFHRAAVDTMMVATETSLGDLWRVQIWHDNRGLSPAWYLSRVIVRDLQNNNRYHFIVEGWLSLTHTDCVIEKKVNAAGPEELHSFKSVFKTKLSEGFSEDHIFMSVFDRPPQATFTRVQRVTCCATFLYTYMFVNAMWYGLLRVPSEKEMLTGETPIEGMDIFVGILASLIAFPLTLALQQMFRHAKHKTSAVGQAMLRPSTAQTIEMDAMISMSSRGSSAVGPRYPRHGQISLQDLDGISSSDSISVHAGRLHRTAPVMRLGREGSLDLSDNSSVHSGVQHRDNNWWSNDGILAWPEGLPPSGDSRQSSASSTAPRFLHNRRHGSGRPKRKISTCTMESEVMELEEIEEVEDNWNNLDDLSAETCKNTNNNSKKTSDVKHMRHKDNDQEPSNVRTERGSVRLDKSVSHDVKETMVDDDWIDSDEEPQAGDGEPEKTEKKMSGKDNEKMPFSPRTEADINQLIEELDAAIEPANKTRSRLSNKKSTSSSSTMCSNLSSATQTSSLSAASGGKITLECPRCSKTLSHPPHDHTCDQAHKPTDNSTPDMPSGGIRVRRDSLAMLRRGSVTFSEKADDIMPARPAPEHILPLHPSAELASMSGVPATNLWAWSRSSTFIDGPQYIPTGPPTDKPRCVLPHWCVYLAYSLCLLLMSISILMVLLYGQAFGQDLSLRWLFACIFTIVLSIFLLEPVKVVLTAVIATLVKKSLERDVHRSGIQPILETNEKLKDDVKIKPVGGFALLQAKEEGRKVVRMHAVLRQFFLYVGLTVVIMTTCYMFHREYTYLLTDLSHGVLLEGKVYNDTSLVMGDTDPYQPVNFFKIDKVEEMWHFLQHTAAPWLHQYDIFPLDTAMYLLGVGRLRQIRSTSVDCVADGSLHDMGAGYLVMFGCYGDTGWKEDKSHYDVGWNESAGVNYTWMYTTADADSVRYYGNTTDYSGGGYIQDLGVTLTETVSIIQDLQLQNWVDRGTRAIILEFALYNANVDLYLITRLGFEFPTSGGIVTSREEFSTPMMRLESDTVNPIMIVQSFLLIFAIWLLVHILTQLCQGGKMYIQSFWSWLEILIGLAVMTSLGLYIANVVKHSQSFSQHFEDRQDFKSFVKDAYHCYVWQCINAVILFMLMMMAVRQLRYIKCMSVYLEAFHKARSNILGVGLIFGIGLLLFAFTGYLWFGYIVYPFHTITDSLGTMVAIFRGISPFFDEMVRVDIHFTTFFIMTFCWLTFVVVFGLMLAVVSDAYRSAKAQAGYHDSMDMKDHELIDFMMERFKMMIKVKKEKPAFRRVKFQGLPTISSVSSHSTQSSWQTRSQTTSSLASDPFDIDWDEVARVGNTEDLLDQAEYMWSQLLDRLQQLEKTEEEEEALHRRIIRQMDHNSDHVTPPVSKGKQPVCGNIIPKGSSGVRGHQRHEEATLVCEKLVEEQQECDEDSEISIPVTMTTTDILHTTPAPVPSNSNIESSSSIETPSPTKSNQEPRIRRSTSLMSRSLSASIMTIDNKPEVRAPRMINSADRSLRQPPLPNATEADASPSVVRRADAWTER